MRGKMKETRQKQITGKKAAGKKVKGPTAFKVADEAFLALDEGARVNLMQSHAADVGMAVISQTDAKKVAEASANLDKAAESLQGLAGVMKAFEALSASDQMKLLRRVAKHLGVKLDIEVADEDHDPGEIPAAFKRQPSRKKAA